MAGKTKLGTYQYEIDIDGKKAVLELKTLEDKTASAAKKIGGLGKSIGENFQNWIKSGLGFNALLGGVRENMMRLFRAISEGVARAAANNKEAKKSFDDFGRGIQNLFTSIGSFMLPLLKAITDAANKAMNALGIATGDGGSTRAKILQGIMSETGLTEEEKKFKIFNNELLKQKDIEDEIAKLKRIQGILTGEQLLQNKANIDALNQTLTKVKEINAEYRSKGPKTMISEEAAYTTRYLAGGASAAGSTADIRVFSQASAAGGSLDKLTAGLNAFGEAVKFVASGIEATTNIFDELRESLVRGDNPGQVMATVQKSILELIPGFKEFNKAGEDLDKSFQKLLYWEKEREKVLREQLRLQQEQIRTAVTGTERAVGDLAQLQMQVLDVRLERGNITQEEYNRLRLEFLNQYKLSLEGIYKIQEETGASQLDITATVLEHQKVLLELEQSKTEEIAKQNQLISSQLQMLIQGGLIDVENIATAARINTELTAQGITGMARFETLSSLGVKGNIGQVNIEVNEASGSTVEDAVSARLLNLFGGK